MAAQLPFQMLCKSIVKTGEIIDTDADGLFIKRDMSDMVGALTAKFIGLDICQTAE